MTTISGDELGELTPFQEMSWERLNPPPLPRFSRGVELGTLSGEEIVEVATV